jgi:hypothetical protein
LKCLKYCDELDVLFLPIPTRKGREEWGKKEVVRWKRRRKRRRRRRKKKMRKKMRKNKKKKKNKSKKKKETTHPHSSLSLPPLLHLLLHPLPPPLPPPLFFFSTQNPDKPTLYHPFV